MLPTTYLGPRRRGSTRLMLLLTVTLAERERPVEGKGCKDPVPLPKDLGRPSERFPPFRPYVTKGLRVGRAERSRNPDL